MQATESLRSTDSLLQSAHATLPGGTLHHLFRMPDGVRTIIARGQGSHIWDVEGKEYVDYFLGAASVVLGHAHRAVNEAVHRQLDLGTQFYELTMPAIELAEALCGVVPCAERVKFACSGTEATMACLRLARAYTGRDKVLKFEGALHGGHDLGVYAYMHKEAMDYPSCRPDSLGVPRSLDQNVLIAPFNSLDFVSSIVEENAGELGAVIVEPTLGAIPPDPGFLEGLRELTRQHGIVLVFDELVTGFRLALGGAQEFFGVVPDLAAFGKALANGLPVGAIAGRADIMRLVSPEAVAEGRFVIYSGTFSGNPLTCTAALATLGELGKPGTFGRLHAIGRELAEGFREIAARRGIPLFVTQVGSILQVWFTQGPVNSYRDALAVDRALETRFHAELIRRGVWALPGTPMFPTLAHSAADIDHTLQAADEALRAI